MISFIELKPDITLDRILSGQHTLKFGLFMPVLYNTKRTILHVLYHLITEFNICLFICLLDCQLFGLYILFLYLYGLALCLVYCQCLISL